MAPRVPPLVVSLVAVAAAGLASQQAPPVFRSGVDLVHLDVSVFDRNRHPVRGLTQADFTLLEDGKRQKIVNFVAVDVPSAPPPPVAWMRDVAPDVQTNQDAERPDSRLIVILIDDAVIPFDPGFIKTAKDIARQVIDRANPFDRLAVVFSAGSGGTQNFTNDRARLLRAVETLNSSYAVYTFGWESARPPPPPGMVSAEPPGPQADPDAQFRIASMATLKLVAEALVSAPQRRKMLVYVSPGLPVDLASAASPVRAGPRTRMRLKEDNESLARERPNLYRLMKNANVNIYPVDPCGPGGIERYVMGVASKLPALQGVTTPPPPGFDWLAPVVPPPPMMLAQYAGGLTRNFAMEVASQTGGFATLDTNDYGPAVDKIFAENESYYVLGFAMPQGRKASSQYLLEVRVNRPGIEVRTRDRYTAAAAAGDSRATSASADLARAGAGPVALADMRLRVAAAPVATPKGPVSAIVVGIEHPPVTAPTTEPFEFRFSLFTPDGQPRGSMGSRTNFTLQPTTGATPVQYEYLFSYSMPPGRYELRVAVTRGSDRVAGSVYANVEVPDFSSAPLSLSGAFVETQPSPPGGPFRVFSGFMPVVPTARREFDKTDQGHVFLRIYQGGTHALATVTVRTRVVDEKDVAITDTSEAFAPARFDAATRSADVRFVLPLADQPNGVKGLPPGSYLLTFDVSAGGHSASRAVRFVVRK